MARLGLFSLILICGTAQCSFGWQPVPRVDNQQMAERIASELRDAGFKGTDIEIWFRGGVAKLEGSVAYLSQKQKAGEVVSRIPGVKKAINSLRVGQADAQPVPGDSPDPAVEDEPVGEESKPHLLSIPPEMRGQLLFGKKLMTRQQELFESDTLHKIEVSVLHKDKLTPLYDIYCGRKQLVVVSRSGGSNFASFEGHFINSFQGGVHQWKSGEKTGTQYECEVRDVLQLFRYVTDVGGLMTQFYLDSQTHAERFKEPIEREDGVKEFRLKQPRDNFVSIAAVDDSLWLCELTSLNADGDEVKRIYSKPIEIDRLPELITRELKAVKFEPTKRTVYSLMPHP